MTDDLLGFWFWIASYPALSADCGGRLLSLESACLLFEHENKTPSNLKPV